MYEVLWVKGGVLAVLLCLSVEDVRKKTVGRLPLTALLIAGGVSVLFSGDDFLSRFLGILTGAAFLWLSFVTEEAIGFGDSAIILAIGAFFGIYVLLVSVTFAFFLAFFAGILLWVRKRRGKKDRIAFLPFLAAGYVMGGFVWSSIG